MSYGTYNAAATANANAADDGGDKDDMVMVLIMHTSSTTIFVQHGVRIILLVCLQMICHPKHKQQTSRASWVQPPPDRENPYTKTVVP